MASKRQTSASSDDQKRYKVKRAKNNEAVKKNRAKVKEMAEQTMKRVKELTEENIKLKESNKVTLRHINIVRTMLEENNYLTAKEYAELDKKIKDKFNIK